MKYGFVIDNRKCIGCHACTVACKSEHDVPVGVNRTWVKQTEKGEFPNTSRFFSVLRCNHCTDAPCVEICPTEALFIRDDGIVDFDNNRCIGCKSCMQACPYDALYIDPETSTAAKCNYCAHRVDVGLEPACVNVCPEHAIISGDMDNPDTEISQLLSREQVSVRKPEKGTVPNVFYIKGDDSSLNPSATERSETYIWGSQSQGVGHFAKYAEARVGNLDLVELAKENNGMPSKVTTYGNKPKEETKKSVQVLMEKSKTKRVYDTPDKGILWGWEVSGYVWTKAISAGAVLVTGLGALTGMLQVGPETIWVAIVAALVFLAATGALLVMDLDQPKRFVYVLLRPQWGSWLVRGGYAITAFGGLVSLWGLAHFMEWEALGEIAFWASFAIGILVAVYTAFLFAQAKGRDFWQSPAMAIHMLVHSFMAGGALFSLSALVFEVQMPWITFLKLMLMVMIGLNLAVMLVELTITHPTQDAKRVVKMIVKERYSRLFWFGAVLVGNLLPAALLFIDNSYVFGLAGVLILGGIYITEKIWVEAPQRIALT